MLQLMAQPMTHLKTTHLKTPQLKTLIAAIALLASAGVGPALAQRAHKPFLRRDVPPTAWSYDGRDDARDFQNNGFFPGDFAAHPADAMIGAAGIFGAMPSGGSHFGQIYCNRRYHTHSPAPGYFQGDDGIRYRCR
jgi:hypothetical protein